MENKLAQANDYLNKYQRLATKKAAAPLLHYNPPLGWMNDPNGLIYFKGQYHLFYQYHPYQTSWQQMYWGHAVSDDLLTWQDLPLALAPTEKYEAAANGGCFSGTALVHEEKLYLFYTSVFENTAGELIQTQSVAFSEDGLHFEKYQNNPIISVDNLGQQNPHFRDPKVWQKADKFYMLVAVSQENKGRLLLYQSPDLLTWEFVNTVLEESGWMVECPDFFELEGQDILTYSPVDVKKTYSKYLVGSLNYQTGEFDAIYSDKLDYGCDFYAPQSWLNPAGERYLLGWQNGWEWMAEWQGFGPADNFWRGAMSIPRKLSLQNQRLCMQLPDKIQQLKKKQLILKELPPSEYLTEVVKLTGPTLIQLELEDDQSETTLVFQQAGQGVADYLIIADEVTYQSKNNPLGRKNMTLPLSAGKRKISILLDLYSLEIFDEEQGRVLSVNSFFSGESERTLAFKNTGVIQQLEISQLAVEKLIL